MKNQINESIKSISKDFKLPSKNKYKWVEILVESHSGMLIDTLFCPIDDTYKTISNKVNEILGTNADFDYEPIRLLSDNEKKLEDQHFDKIIRTEKSAVIDSKYFYTLRSEINSKYSEGLKKIKDVGTFTLRHYHFDKKEKLDDAKLKESVRDISQKIRVSICEAYNIKKEMLDFLMKKSAIKDDNLFSNHRGWLTKESDLTTEIELLKSCHKVVFNYVEAIKTKDESDKLLELQKNILIGINNMSGDH